MSEQSNIGSPGGASAQDALRMERAKSRVAIACASIVAVMTGLSFAAVPLYQMFCQVTGYGGTTQRALKLSNQVVDRPIEVLFDANVRGLAWKFEPVQSRIEVKLGENALVFYRATNTGDKPLSGTAAFNVDPPAAGIHFQKVECFCFKEQTLQPGESIEMPVTFFVDPALAKDKDARHIGRIVLSYTFYPTVDTKSAAATKAEDTDKPSINKGTDKRGT